MWRVMQKDGAEPESHPEDISVLTGKNEGLQWNGEHCARFIWTDMMLIRIQMHI